MTVATIYHRRGHARPDLIAGPFNRSLRCWTAALFISAALATSAGLLGLALGTIAYIDPSGLASHLRVISTVLIVLSFPLFLFTAHCIDKIDGIEKAIRHEYCRQSGLVEVDCLLDEEVYK